MTFLIQAIENGAALGTPAHPRSPLGLGVIFPCPPHACLLLGPALLGWQGTEGWSGVEAGGTCGAVEKETVH